MRILGWILILVACPVGGSVPAVRTLTLYTEKMYLKPGQVHNKYLKPAPLPADIVQRFANRTIHMQGVNLDIVRVDPKTGEERSLPLYEVYNHHQAFFAGPQETLQFIYDKYGNRDPLSPFKANSQLHQHHVHSHSGCSLSGAAMREVLMDLAHPNRGSGKVGSFGGASGAEFRGTNTDMPLPGTIQANSPESFMALIHFINMRDVSSPDAKYFECPCTSARKINVTNGTIDGQVPVPFMCSEELMLQKNPSCSLNTYTGGYRCCEDGVFLTEEIHQDAPLDEFQAKYTVKYYDGDMPDARAAEQMTCCDATGNLVKHGNIEYTVPQCSVDSPRDQCEHMISSIQKLNMPDEDRHNTTHPEDPDEQFDLIHAWGHQHVGAISMELYNEQTGQLLCRTTPQYGQGSEPGDEQGFIVGIPPCVWGPAPLQKPPRLRRADLLRTVARYNSSVTRQGVMSLWILTAVKAPSIPSKQPEVLV